jgi:hypothetical protein
MTLLRAEPAEHSFALLFIYAFCERSYIEILFPFLITITGGKNLLENIATLGNF